MSADLEARGLDDDLQRERRPILDRFYVPSYSRQHGFDHAEFGQARPEEQ